MVRTALSFTRPRAFGSSRADNAPCRRASRSPVVVSRAQLMRRRTDDKHGRTEDALRRRPVSVATRQGHLSPVADTERITTTPPAHEVVEDLEAKSRRDRLRGSDATPRPHRAHPHRRGAPRGPPTGASDPGCGGSDTFFCLLRCLPVAGLPDCWRAASVLDVVTSGWTASGGEAVAFLARLRPAPHISKPGPRGRAGLLRRTLAPRGSLPMIDPCPLVRSGAAGVVGHRPMVPLRGRAAWPGQRASMGGRRSVNRDFESALSRAAGAASRSAMAELVPPAGVVDPAARDLIAKRAWTVDLSGPGSQWRPGSTPPPRERPNPWCESCVGRSGTPTPCSRTTSRGRPRRSVPSRR